MKTVVTMLLAAILLMGCGTGTQMPSDDRDNSIGESLITERHKSFNKYQQFLESNSELIAGTERYTFEQLGNDKFVYKIYHPDKLVKTHEVYYSDKKRRYKSGEYTEWYDNGKKWKSGEYLDDKQEGLWKFYHFPSGKIKKQGKYAGGLEQGQWIELDTLGNIRREYHYKDGKLHGLELYYKENGKITARMEYEDGKLLTSSILDETNYERRYGDYPTYPGCEGDKGTSLKTCFDQQFATAAQREISYPNDAKKRDIKGTFYALLFIDEQGKISGMETMRGLCKELERESLKVLRFVPRMQPATFNGNDIPTQVMVTIDYKED